MGLVKTDMEQELYLAAAKAKKAVDSIEGTRAEEAEKRLGESIHNCVQNARNGLIPIEDAILRLNELTSKEMPTSFIRSSPSWF